MSFQKKPGFCLDPVTNGPFVDDRFMTNVPGIFAAGNVVHVYDLVDWVTEAGYVAGKGAAVLPGMQNWLLVNQSRSGQVITSAMWSPTRWISSTWLKNWCVCRCAPSRRSRTVFW
jgi:hypothetical protein